MKIQGISQGDVVNMKAVFSNHITDGNAPVAKGEKVISEFAKMFNSAIGDVNQLELKSTELANRMAIDPQSVDIHDVQIASEEAEMAILMTKGVVDRVIKAYKEITNLQ
ncbi:MAG: flagellar hook-basal body complex protein FliE [Spirochaetes bacterium GWF1_31_7]|nr:MAG: flagellar hook-basal body complex protein FliE [Spirochaetes bacterium GWE1_32_154]OHD48198.1 MAG: flagellar hook-basal body complex protein FliE [Spirochaetes bacterium GWE2_31_10]OHD50607.1 MAG: flagellar hook-basal body complex protein FliE [Spirochaetes bacterium GWF1_31_7]OHD80453.1 MAG: flagellar hook-basal body complex protein FliE [Spirochaetes bacterium RIFOXYB1_FULL_32_8]HBD94538.1 flagellar hook-basal body complex protein FliE [Spirochaetia bacterium]